jgi:lipopolysaccharide biosynthesis glycosyltransferase
MSELRRENARRMWITSSQLLQIFFWIGIVSAFRFLLPKHWKDVPMTSHLKMIRSGKRIFFFTVTHHGERLSWCFSSLYFMLRHTRPAGYQFVVNIFFFNESLPTDVDDDIRFLRYVNPGVSIVVRNSSIPEVVAKTGIDCQFRDMGAGVWAAEPARSSTCLRLWIPFIYDADWYLYLDTDLIYWKSGFFPAIMKFAKDESKVLFAVQDAVFTRNRRFRKRVWSYTNGVRAPAYFNAGVLLMRSGEILRQELNKTIRFLEQHQELSYPDQDSINLAFNRSFVQFIPNRFNWIPKRSESLAKPQKAVHYAGDQKKWHWSSLNSAIRIYIKARNKWVRKEAKRR